MYYTEQDLKTKFVLNKDTHKTIKELNLKFRFGAFSQRETEIVRSHVHKFLRDSHLTMKDLQNHLHNGTDFPMHELTLYCTSMIEHRTYKSVSAHLSFMYHPFVYAAFSQEDDINLLDLVDKKGYHWKSIGTDIDKYRNNCRGRFMLLKGLYKKSIYRRDILNLVESGLPTTEEEWKEICERFSVSRTTLSARINEYIRGKMFENDDKVHNDMILLVHVLSYNHYCPLPIRIDDFKSFIDNGIDTYADIAIMNSIRADHHNSEIPENCSNFDVSEFNIHKENSEENMYEKNTNYIERNKSNLGNINEEDLNKENTETCLINRNKDKISAFKSKLNEILCISNNFNMNIEIEDQDIFWITISKYMEISRELLKSRFKIIKSSYSLKTYANLVNLIHNLGYNKLMMRMKNKIMKSTDNKGSLKNSDASIA